MSAREITGNLRKRYIQAAVLLGLLDPIRGDPTTYGLDHESHSLHDPLDRVLKRKFLDSFALVCAVRVMSLNTISAACFDKENPEGTVIRIASNAGVSESTLASLRDILRFLCDVAGRVQTISSQELENQVLMKIIILDLSKIRYYLSALRKSREVSMETVGALQSRLTVVLPRASPESIRNFVDWFSKISLIPHLVLNLDADDVFQWIRWAQEARKVHIEFLRAAFINEYNSLQRWVSFVFKLGRYGIAANIFIKTATDIPSMFSHITVEAITAPQVVPFAFPDDETPLISVLRRIPEIKADEAIARLAAIWNTRDIEKFFREKCSKDLAAHAELQIVSFYDENPALKPQSRFIGVSKKSCYLCYNFLTHHPAGFVVSSCHQKMYPSIPPPAKTRRVHLQWKQTTTMLCIRMEAIAREELTERFGFKRSPFPQDSTAGVSDADAFDSREWQVVRLESLAEMEEEDGENEDGAA